MSRKRTLIWIALAAAVTGASWFAVQRWRPRWTMIQGTVIRNDSDTRKESPIANVTVTASWGGQTLTTHSDASGYFRIELPGSVLPGQSVSLSFRHPDYQDADLYVTIRFRSSLRRLVIEAMTPTAAEAGLVSVAQQVVISNIKARYTVNTQKEENIGTAERTFQVVNVGNLPCHRQSLCSPDGYWQASAGTVTLDAGPGNEFRDVRATCIAGPCPFTRISLSGFSAGDRNLVASALDWSDTATFLVEAEVYHAAIGSNVRESYPFVFGRALNFTAPSDAEGMSLEADLNGDSTVFPLGPNLYLSWATCSVRASSETGMAKVYQCELKPGYRF